MAHAPPRPYDGFEGPPVSVSMSLSSRGTSIPSSTSNQHVRRASVGNRTGMPPSMASSGSFYRTSRTSAGTRPVSGFPVMERTSTLSTSRQRSTTDSALMELPLSSAHSASRLSPTNLTSPRRASSHLESASSTRDLHVLGEHGRRPSVLRKGKNRSISPKSSQLPESFRPGKHVFEQSTIRPRPWTNTTGIGHEEVQNDDAHCNQTSVPPEQTEAYQSTEHSVKEAIKSVTMFSIEVVVKILDSGILEYVPIPGLAGLAQALVAMWKVVKSVSSNRLRLLRLAQRCAHLLSSIKKEVEDAGERVNTSLQNALDALQCTFNKVKQLAETQVEAPFLRRLLGSRQMEEQFAACDEELNSALRMFSLSVQLSTMKLVIETTDNLRRQNEDLLLQNQQMMSFCSSVQSVHSTAEFEQKTYRQAKFSSPPISSVIEDNISMSLPETSGFPAEIRRSHSMNHSRIPLTRTTASSRSKQIPLLQKASSELQSQSTRMIRRSSTRRHRNSMEPVSPLRRVAPYPDLNHENPIGEIVHCQGIQNEFDRRLDMEDLRQMIKETLAEGKDSLIIKLLQIDSKDYAQAITVMEQELNERQTGKDSMKAEDKDIQQEFIQRGVDALRRMTQEEDLVLPEWTINKFKILELEVIGYGAFSTVRRGLWNDQVVAIKILSPKTKPTVFENEMRIWKGLHHPNILPLFGASNAGEEPLFFVSSYARYGNLVDFLQMIRQHDLEGVFGPLLKERNSLNTSARKRHSRQHSGMREQAHHNRWNADKSSPDGDVDKLYTLPLSKSESKFNHCHILREGDMYRFMLDIARGMEYLHDNGVFHGDLKASNVLVNDDISCILSDFGQSERRNDIYRASGWTPKGTARWKAPELLTGSEGDLTPAIDVYAYAITCVEILSMGGVPWGSMEDSSLACRIVGENLRPPIPPDFRHPRLEQLFEGWWHKEPAARPEFKEIVVSVQALAHGLVEGALDEVRRKSGRSPFSPQSPDLCSPSDSVVSPFDTRSPLSSPLSPSSSTHHETGRSYFPDWVSPNFSELHLSPSSLESDPSSRNDSSSMPTPMLPSLSIRGAWEPIESPQYSQSGNLNLLSASPSLMSSEKIVSSMSTMMQASETYTGRMTEVEVEVEQSFVPVDNDDKDDSLYPDALELRCEELYRLVQHDFHWTLKIPLWNPVPVHVGDLGYIHQPTRTFITLFNAFEPFRAPYDSSISIPSILGFGDPVKKHAKIPTQKAKRLFRAFTYKLEVQVGQPVAHCFCESPDWHYLEETRPAQAWFKASVDSIVKIHEEQHNISREDLLLVVGSLQASRYSLLVSDNHPTGTVEFTASSAKKGRPWGSFGAISVQRSGPAYTAEGCVMASRVSEASGSAQALFLSALQFPPGSSEPILA